MWGGEEDDLIDDFENLKNLYSLSLSLSLPLSSQSLSNLEKISQNFETAKHSRWKSEVSSKLQIRKKYGYLYLAAHVLSHFFEKETHLKHVYKNTVRNLEKESENIGTLYCFVTK